MDKSMSKTFKTTLVIIGIVGLFLSIIAVQPHLSDWAQSKRTGHNTDVTKTIESAYVNHNQGDHDDTVKQGDLFFVKHHFHKNLECAVLATRYLVQPSTGLYYSFGTTTTTWMMPGEYNFNEAYNLPDNVPPGDYRFQMKTISKCGGNDYYTMGFDVPVKVLPKD